MGKILTQKDIKNLKYQFGTVDDVKLRMTLAGLANKYSEEIREMVYRAYQDDQLASIYRRWRASGFQKGSKNGAHHREIVRFPNGYIFDFVDTVLTALYGPKWMQNTKAMKHELVRPWHIVEHL
jgi:hypothetical protein